MPSTFARLHDNMMDRLYAADSAGLSETFTVSQPLEERELHELCRRLERAHPDYSIDASQQITLIATPKGAPTE